MNDKVLSILIKAQDQASKVLNGVGGTLDGLAATAAKYAKVAAVAFAAAGTAAAGFALKSASDFEQTRIGIENMVGSAEVARATLEKVSLLAAKTPFQFPELAQGIRQLLAFGFSAEDAYDTLTQLGDVSAAIGAPIGDLAYLMGTLRTQGRAFTIDIRQFAMRGIPIYEYLAQVMNKNLSEVNALIEAGKVGFPEVQKAFQAMTAEGGKFHGTMAKQSQSLAGLFSTLKDNLAQTGRELIGINAEGDVREGSVFDKLRNAVSQLIVILPSFIQFMSRIGQSIAAVAAQVIEYLGPSLEALWTTISTRLMPTIERWLPFLQFGAQVLGVIMVNALWVLINTLNVLASTLGWIGQVVGNTAQWFIDRWHNITSVWSQAFGFFRSVGGAIADAFSTVREAIVKPFRDAYEFIKSLPQKIAAAFQGIGGTLKRAIADVDLPGPLPRIKDLPGFATGGFTGRGGANEVAGVVHRGEYVLPKSMVNQSTGQPMLGGGATFNMYGQINLGSKDAVDRFFDRLNAQKELAALGVGV